MICAPLPFRMHSRRSVLPVILFLLTVLLLAGCFPGIKLLPDTAAPLKEYVLDGDGRDKVAVININGMISDRTHKDLMSREMPSLLQEAVAQLNMAEADPAVRAVVLKIDSPGGAVTASDILYQRIRRYKQTTGAAVVAALMGTATSGGYYIALPADKIVAHPTTVTGSVGVIFITPQVYQLLDTVGIGVNVRTSGRNKDMGSPFRPATAEEEVIFDALINHFGDRFLSLVKSHRGDRGLIADEVKTARIFTADEALRVGLVDRIGYLEDALATARQLAGLPENTRTVVYRRNAYANDTLYNTLSTRNDHNGPALVNIDLLNVLPAGATGFYYLWWPSASDGAAP